MKEPRSLSSYPGVLRPIIGFHVDVGGHWVADLSCGHGQHVRHEPPMVSRPWVLTAEGRASMLGSQLSCVRCKEEVSRGPSAQRTVWTIGHSTRSGEKFARILTAHGIELVADVRRFPGSRRLPQFASEALERDLARRDILYSWLPMLGGRRAPNASSLNLAWRHPSFRAYADHVATEEFAEGLEDLLILAFGLRTAIMCAELLWWRCHRRIIADVLTSLDLRVMHLRDEGEGELHHLIPPARMVRGELTYVPA
ncbi:MAG: DUF3565 domain-containing protein [Gemmatimonadota bacterium]